MLKAFPFHGERVTIEPEDVVRVDGTDSGLEAVVKGWETVVKRVAGLVDGVIACDPGVISVVLCDLTPEPDRSVLVVLVVPKRGISSWGIGVPVRVLTPRDGVHVEDRVDAVFGALRGISLGMSLLVITIPILSHDQGA